MLSKRHWKKLASRRAVRKRVDQRTTIHHGRFRTSTSRPRTVERPRPSRQSVPRNHREPSRTTKLSPPPPPRRHDNLVYPRLQKNERSGFWHVYVDEGITDSHGPYRTRDESRVRLRELKSLQSNPAPKIASSRPVGHARSPPQPKREQINGSGASPYLGVQRVKNYVAGGMAWKAVIPPAGKRWKLLGAGNQRYELGKFNTEIEAAMAYNEKAIDLRGNSTKINHFTIEEREKYDTIRRRSQHREHVDLDTKMGRSSKPAGHSMTMIQHAKELPGVPAAMPHVLPAPAPKVETQPPPKRQLGGAFSEMTNDRGNFNNNSMPMPMTRPGARAPQLPVYARRGPVADDQPVADARLRARSMSHQTPHSKTQENDVRQRSQSRSQSRSPSRSRGRSRSRSGGRSRSRSRSYAGSRSPGPPVTSTAAVKPVSAADRSHAASEHTRDSESDDNLDYSDEVGIDSDRSQERSPGPPHAVTPGYLPPITTTRQEIADAAPKEPCHTCGKSFTQGCPTCDTTIQAPPRRDDLSSDSEDEQPQI